MNPSSLPRSAGQKPATRQNREVEAKFVLDRPEDFDCVLERLKALGYRAGQSRQMIQRDTYFDMPTSCG
jgi:adenylate cyclase class IV